MEDNLVIYAISTECENLQRIKALFVACGVAFEVQLVESEPEQEAIKTQSGLQVFPQVHFKNESHSYIEICSMATTNGLVKAMFAQKKKTT